MGHLPASRGAVFAVSRLRIHTVEDAKWKGILLTAGINLQFLSKRHALC